MPRWQGQAKGTDIGGEADLSPRYQQTPRLQRARQYIQAAFVVRAPYFVQGNRTTVSVRI